MWIDVQYTPGTVKRPQHTDITSPAFVDTSRVHFPDGILRTIPGWSDIAWNADYVDFLGGVRSIFAATLTGTYQGNYYLFGSNGYLFCLKNRELYNITPLQTTAEATLGSDPLSFTNTDATMTVTYVDHGLSPGDRIKLTGATNAAGIVAATYINIEHIVATVVDDDNFTVELGDDATSTASGGGSSIDIFYQIASGNLDQGAAEGFGVGEFGEGLFGSGGEAGSAQSFPRIWSFDNFGNELVMCPGDYTAGDGQKIYIWDGDTSVAPSVLSNAPTDCNWVLVVNNSIVALCGNTIKISELGDGTVWSGVTYTASPVQRIWKLVSGRAVGDKAAVIYTPNEALYLRWQGEPDLWDLADLTNSDGIIAPQAACVIEETIYWRGRRGMYRFNGSTVEKRENTQNEDWIISNTNYAQAWKCFAMPDPQNSQVWHFFPTGENDEPSDYCIDNYLGNHFTLGKLDRTAAQLPGTIGDAYYMAYGDDDASEGEIYRHFVENDELSINAYAQTSYAYGGNGRKRMYVSEVIPDMIQDADTTLTIYGREYPQGSASTFGAYTIEDDSHNVSVKAAGRLLSMRWDFPTGAATLGAWKQNIRLAGKDA